MLSLLFSRFALKYICKKALQMEKRAEAARAKALAIRVNLRN